MPRTPYHPWRHPLPTYTQGCKRLVFGSLLCSVEVQSLLTKHPIIITITVIITHLSLTSRNPDPYLENPPDRGRQILASFNQPATVGTVFGVGSCQGLADHDWLCQPLATVRLLGAAGQRTGWLAVHQPLSLARHLTRPSFPRLLYSLLSIFACLFARHFCTHHLAVTGRWYAVRFGAGHASFQPDTSMPCAMKPY
jgi:hypothetical protein